MGCDCQSIGSLKNAGLLNLNSKRKAINVCNSYRTDNFNHPLSQVLHFINEKTQALMKLALHFFIFSSTSPFRLPSPIDDRNLVRHHRMLNPTVCSQSSHWISAEYRRATHSFHRGFALTHLERRYTYHFFSSFLLDCSPSSLWIQYLATCFHI